MAWRRQFGFRPRVERLEERTTPANLPPGFVDTIVGNVFNDATAMELDPNGDPWVLQQSGRVLRFRPGIPTPDIVADLSTLGLDPTAERGLLGIAFDPKFASNRHVFFYYTTNDTPRRNRISRFTVNISDPTDYFLVGTSTVPEDAGSAGTPTETVILNLDALSGPAIHNGGAIHFGANGLLYAAVGDNANGANSQDVTNLHGKILRLNASNFDGTFNSLVPKGKKANPKTFRVWNGSNFVSASTSGQERLIFAIGLRNPFTFAFRPGTNKFYINDVGQNHWEEINVGGKGHNYGWPTTEGNFNQASFPEFTRPFFAYSHTTGTPQGNVITGGAFYNPVVQQFPAEYGGDYFFADLGAGWIYRIDTTTKAVTQFATGAHAVDLRVAPDGSLYYLSLGDKKLHRVTFHSLPTISQHPADTTVAEDNDAVFNVVATGEPAPTYQWQRADSATPNTWVNIDGATGASYTLNDVTPADNGDRFRVVVTNSAGSVTSNPAVLTVIPPVPVAIVTPPASQLVNEGALAVFTVSVTGTGPLTYEWQRFDGVDWQTVGGNASTFSFTAAASDDGAQFRVVVSNSISSETSAVATLDVNLRPNATIDITDGLTNGNFIAGQTISFTAGGSDPEDGGVNAVVWRVEYVTSLNTNPVVRPFVPPTNGTSGLFTPETSGPYNLTDVVYRITVTVTDSLGLTGSTSLDINPEVWSFTIQTTPPGLDLTVDAIPTPTPAVIESVVGFIRPLGAIFHFGYLFQQWSDGQTSANRVVTGLGDPTSFTAEYQEVFSARVNFQTPNSEGFPDYLADVGAVFGDRGNGFNYGWKKDNSSSARNRNSSKSLDERYDTFLLMPTKPKVWEIEVPNGVYLVRIVAGDPKAYNSIFRIDVEGVRGLYGKPTRNNRWLDQTVTATVQDGRLTIQNGPGAEKNKIDFIELMRIADETAPFLQESGPNGLVVIEAEHFHGHTSQGERNWELYTGRKGFSGTGAMIAKPNTGLVVNTGYAAASPQLDFQVFFQTTGVHYVWLRGLGRRAGDNSVHLGLDGMEVATADRIGNFPDKYAWVGRTLDGPRARIDVTTPGLHTINVWMREDGMIVDRILLTTNASYQPKKRGPAESGRHFDTGLPLLSLIAEESNSAPPQNQKPARTARPERPQVVGTPVFSPENWIGRVGLPTAAHAGITDWLTHDWETLGQLFARAGFLRKPD